jgi:hypothetical protein
MESWACATPIFHKIRVGPISPESPPKVHQKKSPKILAALPLLFKKNGKLGLRNTDFPQNSCEINFPEVDPQLQTPYRGHLFTYIGEHRCYLVSQLVIDFLKIFDPL